MFPQVPINNVNERALAALFGEYVGGGMNGLVFQELREARGLAYASFAVPFLNKRKIDEAMILGFIGTQAEKTGEALQAMLDLFNGLKIDPERFAVATFSLDKQIRFDSHWRLIAPEVFAWMTSASITIRDRKPGKRSAPLMSEPCRSSLIE